eukprot:CAMPEP_0198140368 /NCGR_PEP_ID=MMETSP1443-20131203/3534_1 /TAXON_ID=186043 /ORGANISM="Entomoneis sp., Strain CCMP2396" /LENGTH=323 /DNA_ID=CAMNT_0043802761 /DNA_START=68 /DNA_END=1039 /DNA_ORIENTATION=-
MATAMRSAALVTGATDGIGVTTAKHLAAKGYTVLLHGRSEERLDKAKLLVETFVNARKTVSKEEHQAKIVYCLPAADLSTVSGSVALANSALELCREHDLKVVVLMNNAGVYSKDRIITLDGTELTFAVNVVAPFVITSLLLPHMATTATGGMVATPQQHEDQQTTSRIVTTSSISQCSHIRDWNDMEYSKRRYSAHSSYSESKLLDAMLTMEMSKRLVDAGLAPDQITCNCLDPGTVNTKMLLAGWGPIGIDVQDALDQTWLCTSNEVQGVTGKYFVYQHERQAARSAYDPTERQRMWSLLEKLSPEAAAIWSFEWLLRNNK